MSKNCFWSEFSVDYFITKVFNKIYALQIVQSATSPVTCSTVAVKSNFKYGYHIYGQQEAIFDDVDIHHDMLLVARFYLRQRVQPQHHLQDEKEEPWQDYRLQDSETLVAWGTMPLMVARGDGDFDGEYIN